MNKANASLRSFSLTAAAAMMVFGLASCSLFNNNSDSPNPQPEMKKSVRDTVVRRDDNSPRKRMMVLPFLDANEAHPQELRDIARKDFISQLNKSRELIVVDTSELKIDLNKNMKSGEFMLPEIGKAASELGVNALMEGKIMDLHVARTADPVGMFRQLKTKFEASVRVRVAIARSGKEIFNTTKTVTLEESTTRVAQNVTADRMLQTNPELMEKLVSDAFLDFEPQIYQALNKLSWEGRIAVVSGERIFLNVGRVSGVQVGDLLRVTDEGEEIFDAQTGAFIGKAPGRLKGTLEVVSYFGQDGSIAIVHSGAGFKENDRVEQY